MIDALRAGDTDAIDHRFRYPEQIAKEMGLEILGAVPNVKRPKPGR